MTTLPRTKILLTLLAVVGIASVSVAYAAEVVEAVSGAVTVAPTIDLGSILTMVLIAGGGISVWVKINRSDARQDERLQGLKDSLSEARKDHRALRDLVNQILLGKQVD